jgi:hypothetical protein
MLGQFNAVQNSISHYKNQISLLDSKDIKQPSQQSRNNNRDLVSIHTIPLPRLEGANRNYKIKSSQSAFGVTMRSRNESNEDDQNSAINFCD